MCTRAGSFCLHVMYIFILKAFLILTRFLVIDNICVHNDIYNTIQLTIQFNYNKNAMK